MDIKWIYGTELKVLADVVETMGWTPIPAYAIALAAFDEKGLAGFHVLQSRPHVEPLWVREDHRGNGLASNLAAGMEEFLRQTKTEGFMVVADTPEAVSLCEIFGMRRVDSPVYVR